MKVLMFGWEFPPFKSGGLGTACYDLTKGLADHNVEVTFVMPKAPENAEAEFVKLVGVNNLCKNIKIKTITTVLQPYHTSKSYSEKYEKIKLLGTEGNDIYGTKLHEEVERYTKVAEYLLKEEAEKYDIIHVHDWMTYKAGILAKKSTKKPLVAHIHATEFDRTGGNPNHYISDLEHKGMSAADIVIANSEYTKKNVMRDYNINPNKIKVVHWGIENERPEYYLKQEKPFKEDKIVLFLGRVTIQKGPEYFVETAKKVLEHVPNTRFFFAGSGDMMPMIIDKVHQLKMEDRFHFLGFVKGTESICRTFQMADLYVMPSVSEPFGLVALESIKNGTPILISKQSGASEVINNALKTNFWDVNEMANKIVMTLKYPELYNELKENSDKEAKKFNLQEPAKKTLDIYHEAKMLFNK